MRVVGTLLFSIIVFTWGNAQPASYTAAWYHSQNTGLSHNTVTGITMDQEGFLWVSTIDGLNRFDGKSVKIYRHEASDSTSISDNFIHGVLADEKGMLWIGTRDGGINKFDPVTEHFQHYKYSDTLKNSIPNAPLNLFFKDEMGAFWASVGEESFGIFDPQTGAYQKAKIRDTKTRDEISSPNTVVIFNDGSMMGASFTGLFYLTAEEVEAFREDHKKTTVEAEQINLSSFGALPNLNRLVIDKYGAIWFSGDSETLLKVDKSVLSEAVISAIESGTRIELSNKHFIESGDQLIYGAGVLGICTMNILTENNSCEQIEIGGESFDPTKLYQDPEGGIWATSWGKGFIRLEERETFKLFNTANQPGMDTNFILAFEEEPGKGLWIGGSNGIYFLNTESQTVSRDLKIAETLRESSIWSLERGSSGLWVVSIRRGLFFIPLNSDGKVSGVVKNFTPENSFISSYLLHQVLIDSRGWMWLGYEGNGLQLIREPNAILNDDPVNVEQFLPEQAQENDIGGNKIRKIYEDLNGDIWLATMQNGFTKIDINKGIVGNISVFRHDPEDVNSISFNDGRSIYHQNDSTYWFATYGGGINRWNVNTDEFMRLGTEQGLANNSTYGILPDMDDSYIWISTNSGLSRLNTESLEFNTYTPEEGIQNLEFNTGAYHQMSNGWLAFGGIGGFNIIDTEKLKINNNPPPIYITDIKLFNESYEADTSAVYKNYLKLKYDQNFLSFEFSALDLSNPSANQYAYKMEGVDNEWVYSENRNFADYPNLQAGDYKFRVRASNSDGIWNEAGISLPISITPPWWQTLWFRITAGSILFTGFILGIRYFLQRRLKEQIRQMEMENKLRNERERISRDLHDHVGAQLANIKTGLSLADKYSKSDNKEKSSDLMNSIMNDADLTIKQLRETIWALNQSSITLAKFMEHVKMYFRNQTSFNEVLNLNYSLEADDELELSATQALNIFRIVQEASQNTLKYANAQNLKVSILHRKGCLNVVIEDDGCFKGGEADFNSGYGMGNMKKRAQEIEGEITVGTSDGTKIMLTVGV